MDNDKFKVIPLLFYWFREAPGSPPLETRVVQKAVGVQKLLQLKGKQAVNLEEVKKGDRRRAKEERMQLASFLKASFKHEPRQGLRQTRGRRTSRRLTDRAAKTWQAWVRKYKSEIFMALRGKPLLVKSLWNLMKATLLRGPPSKH